MRCDDERLLLALGRIIFVIVEQGKVGEYSRTIDKLFIFYWLGLENDDARFSSDDSGGNENAARYFPRCYWYIYSAGEPDRPMVIYRVKAELALT